MTNVQFTHSDIITQKHQEIEKLTYELERHPLYAQVADQKSLQVFMECHVFAVFDFMSLLKGLQRNLTCVTVPWRPVSYPKKITRFINEIVLGEESDVCPDGKTRDHFTLYLEAMEEVGANTKAINQFVKDLDFNKIPDFLARFVSYNFDRALNAPVHEVAAMFFYGREKLIPSMFTSVLNEFKNNNQACPCLYMYLERHIELDGDEHSVLAKDCLEILCEGDNQKYIEALEAGIVALNERKKLWNGTLELIKKLG